MITGIGTWAGLITALCTMIIALLTLTINVKTRRASKTVEDTHRQTIEIHQLVNQRFTDMERYQVALLNALKAAGADIPDDQSKLDTR